MLDKSAVSSKSRQPIYFFYFTAMATPLCLHSSPRHQPKPSTPSTPSTPKLFPLSAPFFLVNWSYTSNNVRCPWQAPPVFFSSLLFISEPIFLLPLLRQIQLFLYHLPILHTHCYYYIDFQCFVFQSLLLVRDSKNRVSLFSTLSVKIDTEHRFLLQFLPALYMVTTERIRTPSTYCLYRQKLIKFYNSTTKTAISLIKTLYF